MATSRRPGRAGERRARQSRQGRYGSKDDGPRDKTKESCLEGAADQCVMCRQCCPQMWLSALPAVFLALLRRPSSGRDPAAPRPAGRSAGALYAGAGCTDLKLPPASS
ncbi:hypothetical protein ACFQ7N_35600 [Streptomyces niveus]|uniref:hypothetical protein n=1 Tax=Streptomyces niveus TaxID=193462 RepID=UPI0036B5E467